jgi:uncharacterized cupredoxin-like copper-binding protein
MRRTARWLMSLGLLPLVLAAGLGMACSSSSKESPSATKTGSPVAGTSESGQSALAATLVDYKILLPKTPAKSGDVTFNVTNSGATIHELVVLKTDLAPAVLPTKADGSANEDATEVTNVGETGDMAAGASMPLTIDLQPGHYVFICNVVQTTNGQTVSHYEKGMTGEFTVAP